MTIPRRWASPRLSSVVRVKRAFSPQLVDWSSTTSREWGMCEVFNFIANNVTENVRDLEGILVSLMANAVINNREIDLPLTKRVVSQAVRLEKKQISVQMIQEIVCKYFNLEQSVIQTNSRKREIVQARQITMYLAKKYTDSSFSHIGKIVGKKDHATVLHACKTIKDQIETSKSFRSSVEEIEVLLKN